MESRLSPQGEVSFNVICDLMTNKLNIQTKSFTNTQISPLNFVEQYLDASVQRSLNMKMLRVCMATEPCDSYYEIVAMPLSFNIRACTYNPIVPEYERFTLTDSRERKYYFMTTFASKETSIEYAKSKYEDRGSITIPFEKFAKYPLDREFLLNKIKTLILFT
jgi:hypothetical protein